MAGSHSRISPDGQECNQSEILREIRDSQIRSEERIITMDKRISDLEATRSRIGWWIIGGVAFAVAGLFTVVPKVVQTATAVSKIP